MFLADADGQLMLVDSDSVGDDLVVAEVAELTKTVTVNITDDGVCDAVDKCVQTYDIRETSEYEQTDTTWGFYCWRF
jgi:hypothetical protein